MNDIEKKSKGIGLIEVLITTVVIAVGLLAVASLQGELMGNSGQNKIRTEAKTLSDTKIEQLRDALMKTDYDATVSSTANETISGTNAVFIRSWVVDTLPDVGAANAADQTGPARKRIRVTTSWGGGGADEQVVAQSIIGFEDLGSSSLAALTTELGGLNMNSPSTNANSSDEINDATDIAIPAGATPEANGLYLLPGLEAGQYVKDNGGGTTGSLVFLCADLIFFENGLYTRRVHYKPAGTTFKEAIELFEMNNDGFTCTRRIRYNGGIIIPITGIVYSRATTGSGGNTTLLELRNSSNTQLFTFNATESGSFCVFEPATGSTSAPYVCYVGGNCVNGPVGTITDTGSAAVVGDNTVVTQCPAPVADPSPTPPYATGVYQAIGPGGWRGKVGLLGIPVSGKNVCFAEELIAIQQQQASQHTLDTARNYFTRRVNNSVNTNEGINRPYHCHDMVIINGKNTIVQVHDECIQESASIAGLALASKNIQRDLSGTTANSVVLTPDTTFCATNTATSYTIVGTISNAASTPAVTLTDGAISGDCTSTPPTLTAYTCTITTAANAVTVSGTDSNGSASCFLSPPGSTGCDLAFTQTSGTRTVTAAVNTSGTGTVSNTVVTGTGATCVGTECTVADDWTGTLTATADCSGTPTTVTGTSATIAATDVTTTISLEECVEAVVTHTVSGTVSIHNLVNNLTTVSVNINGSLCSGNLSTASNSSSDYSCTVPDNTIATFEVTISPQCNNKKYTISSGGSDSTGTGVLTISLGTITADVDQDVYITRSSTNCN